MSRTQLTRYELVIAIIAQLRSSSTRTVLFHAAVAERLGLNPSDHKCADLLLTQPAGSCTPGRLAELTGLSTGAITGVIDRLERAGFVAREHDAQDRRRILLRVTRTRAPDMHKLFAPLAAATESMCAGFTVDELETVLRFLCESMQVLDEAREQLRTSDDQLLAPQPAPTPARVTRTRRPAPNASASRTGRGKRTRPRTRV